MNHKLKIIIPALIQIVFLQCISAQSPADLTDSLRLKFSSYIKAVPREEIYIHTDRQDYISGEDLWFNVYLVDRQSFRPSLNSSIVYFELLNSDYRPIIQKKIAVKNGSGPGAIVIPDTISTGNYKIRAYTSWMRNFLPENCFQADIRIYNALNVRKIYSKKITPPARINEAEVNSAGSGISLAIDNSRPDMLDISVMADNKFIKESDNLFYIFIQTHGNIDHVSREKIAGPVTKLEISKASIGKGINQITVFNSKGKPVAVRYIFTPSSEKCPYIISGQDSCGIRKKIRFELDPSGTLPGVTDSTNISISVAPRTGNGAPGTITGYMTFGSEYGLLYNNSGVENLEDLPRESADSILSSISSNWIDWTRILSGKIPSFNYQMENDGPVILGKLFPGDQQSENQHKKVFMCMPGKDPDFQYSITDDQGNFSFHIMSGIEHGDFILMPEDNSGKQKIILRSSFSDIYPKPSAVIDSSSFFPEKVITKMSVNHQVQAIYATYSGQNQVIDNRELLKSRRFYGKPDRELIMSDYISLPVMSEVFFELLPGVSMKKKQSGYEILLIEHVNDEVNVEKPTLMIDGVIIPDASLIANLDPDLVEKIDIVRGRYAVGKHIFPGIVNVITKKGDFSCVSLTDYMIRLHYNVTDPVMSFVSPDYSSEEAHESRIPDYRNTYYWNPAVKTGKDGKATLELWSSDNKGDFVINIQGFNRDGRMFSLSKLICVK